MTTPEVPASLPGAPVDVAASMPAQGGGQALVVPAYQYPTLGIWPTLAEVGPSVSPSYVIANIASGPGTSANPDYVAAIANAKAAGWSIMGYVDTDYAGVALATVEANIDYWHSLYGVVDIFFDRADSTSANIGYYTGLTDYVHTRAGISMLNMGDAPAPGYLSPSVCDGICVFEGRDRLSRARRRPITPATA